MRWKARTRDSPTLLWGEGSGPASLAALPTKAANERGTGVVVVCVGPGFQHSPPLEAAEELTGVILHLRQEKGGRWGGHPCLQTTSCRVVRAVSGANHGDCGFGVTVEDVTFRPQHVRWCRNDARGERA